MWKILYCNSTTCSCENGKYLGSCVKDSANICEEIINDADSVSTKVPTNVNSTMSFHNKSKI